MNQLTSNDESQLTKRMQGRILEILSAVHRLCVEEGIRYFMIGGTLIGAVRHGGFIPWDDDIDIGVPRPDYNRLLQSASKLGPDFAIHHFGNDPSYVYPYAKCYDTRTTVIELLARPFKRGAWIDIFPLDGLPEDTEQQRRQVQAVSRLRRLLVLNTGAYFPKTGSATRDRLHAVAAPFARMLPRAVIARRLDRVLRQHDYDSAPRIANLTGRYGIRELTERQHFESHVELDFAGRRFRAPVGYDQYLRGVYGEYMRLPPPEKQVSNHAQMIVDFDTPFASSSAR